MSNQNFKIKLNNILSINHFFTICAGSFWFLALAVRRWMSSSLFLTFVVSSFILARNKKNGLKFLPKNGTENWLLWLSIALASPIFATLLGQLFRHDFNASGYDSSLRFFLSISVLYAIIQNKSDTFKYLEYAIPTALFASLISLFIKPNPNPLFLQANRLSTYFVDPLAFGSISLTLALMSLLSINLSKNDNFPVKAFKLAGFLVGIYLSVVSGSRTGWTAIPVVLLLWIYIKFSGKHLLVALISTLVFIKALFFIPVVQQRIDIAVSDISTYQWSSLNAETSVGQRISFVRIGIFLFSHNLFSGWGESGFKALLNAPELSRFASASTRNLALTAGFHNEIIANMVRSGIWGLISSVSVFLAPLCLFIKGLRSNSVVIRNYALVAMSYLICVFITGMTTEVFSSKLTVSFYAILMVNLIGSLLVIMSSPQQSKTA